MREHLQPTVESDRRPILPSKFPDLLRRRLPKPVRLACAGLSVATSLALAACGPTPKPSPEVQRPQPSPAVATTAAPASEISFGYPFSGLWYLSAGPHSDGLTGGVRAALDFGPPEVVDCPGRKPLENRFVEASAAGKVAIVGNERDPTDQNHSTVEIDHGQGLRTGYVHLANTSVNVGQEVKQGQRLGNPSCEIPPDGATYGIHLHWYVKKDGKFIPADGIKFPQGQIKASPSNKDGTLIGPNNFVRTADERRCGPNESSIRVCGGKRNDLNTGAVLGESVKVTPLPTVAAAKPAPPTPTREAPKPTVKPQIPAIPWAQVSLGGLVEGQGKPVQGFKWVAAYLWVRNPTSSWQTFRDSPTGGLPGRAKTIDSSDFEHPADVKYSMGSLDTSLAGIPIPPKGAVRFHVLAQIPATRQPKMFVLQSQKMAELFQLTLPFAEGNTPKALFERTTDFPAQSTETTLSCPRDRDIRVKFSKLVKDLFPHAKFDLTIHNNGGKTIRPDDYYIITETWSSSGMFLETETNHVSYMITGPSIPPDREEVGSMGAKLAYDFGSGNQNKAPVVTYPQLVRITIRPDERQPNQPACTKKEMLFRIDEP